MLGRVIGGYRLEEQLGQGTFGVVYLGRHVDTDWVMAVKVARERRFGELLREEGRLLARLEHPNVVRLQHMETSGEVPFVVMEYVEGQSLARALREGAMKPGRVLAMARELLGALEAAHGLGILHRDIKPSNVLLTKAGTAKLADFGLGRVAAQESLLLSRTDGSLAASMMRSQASQAPGSSGGEVVGTLAYMAPEQLRGEEVDCRADLYSLGVVLYEALTGELPVGRFEMPGELADGVPGELDRLVESLLATRPAARPEGALVARAALTPRAAAAPASPAATTTAVAPVPRPIREVAPEPDPIPAPAIHVIAGLRESPGSRVGEEIEGPDGGTMVWVPAGEFPMGSTAADVGYAVKHLGAKAEWLADEQPQHKVRLTQGFWLAKCEVTNRQYRAFCEATGRKLPAASYQGDKHPVVDVSWEDAQAYCEHYGLRLPTEAEWEYAARGPESRRYPWGNEWDAQKCCNSGNLGPLGRTYPVGRFAAGASWCGALDLSGNVWEWCADWYDDGYYAQSPASDPPGPPSGEGRLVRGGSWVYGPNVCRSANRFRSVTGLGSSSSGFRVARTP